MPNRVGGLVVVANEILVSAQGPLVLCFGLKGLGPGLKKISKSMLLFPKSKPPSFNSKIQRQRNLNVDPCQQSDRKKVPWYRAVGVSF